MQALFLKKKPETHPNDIRMGISRSEDENRRINGACDPPEYFMIFQGRRKDSSEGALFR